LGFFAHFEIDLVTALAEQLVAAFAKLEEGTLTLEHINEVPHAQGVYHLFREGTLVYVGKDEDDLRKRLTEHREKIAGRRNIDVGEMGFKCLTLHKNWAALAPEASLIKHYQTQPNICEWNGNGFGSHDPGRNRETTNQHQEGFDSIFEIRDDWPCKGIKAGRYNARELLILLKTELPFLLRYQTKARHYRAGHEDYDDVTVEVPHDEMPAIELLKLVTQHLPGWQATRFPSYMILYKEKREYKFGTVIWYQPTKG
jgi:hypothetical protein